MLIGTGLWPSGPWEGASRGPETDLAHEQGPSQATPYLSPTLPAASEPVWPHLLLLSGRPGLGESLTPPKHRAGSRLPNHSPHHACSPALAQVLNSPAKQPPSHLPCCCSRLGTAGPPHARTGRWQPGQGPGQAGTFTRDQAQERSVGQRIQAPLAAPQEGTAYLAWSNPPV